jgi:hypothetical protein
VISEKVSLTGGWNAHERLTAHTTYTNLCAVRTTVILDDALFQEATKVVLAQWLSKNELPPRRWKTLVIEEGLQAVLRDPDIGRRPTADRVNKPKNLTIIVDEALLRRAERLVAKELGGDRERTRMAGAVINHGLRALLRQGASRRLATLDGVELEPDSAARRARAG